MEVIVKSNEILVKGTPDDLNSIHEHFSFTDRQIEHLLNRHYKNCHFRELKGNKFPGYDEWKLKRENELKSKLVVYCGILDGSELRLPIGLLTKTLVQTGVLFCKDERDFDVCKKELKGEEPKLRIPQTQALDKATCSYQGLIRMATGVGKTMVGQELIRYFGLESIFLVPSKQILLQTYERFRSAFGRRSVGIYGSGKKKHNIVTVATYQSVFNAPNEDFDQYRLMIADEVHHVAADTFFEVAHNRLAPCLYRFGLTADEERSDGGTILVEAAVGPVIYSYEAPEAIRDGFLAKPTFIVYEVCRTEGSYIQWETNERKQRIPVGIIESWAYPGDDPHQAYKNWVVGNDLLTQKVAQLAKAFHEEEKKSVLILVDEKEHGEKFLKYFGNEAQFIHSGSKNNDEVVEKFNRRQLPIVIATSVLGEGADTVPVDVLFNLMGGTKPKQANGRALRNDPDENGVPRKPTCLIVDFDFPNSQALSRHFELRSEVHQQCGEIHRFPLI